MSSCSRRDFFKLPLALGTTALFERDGAGADRRVIDEYDPANIKLAHRVPARIADDDLLFLKQIGMRWARVELGDEDAPLDSLRATQQRYARFGIQIYSAVHPAYRSLKIQLGQPGRDRDIETFQRFLRDLGRLGIAVANIDFHPANTYTTAMVESPRGYTVREFKQSDFRSKVEKQAFEREYSAAEIWANYAYFIKAVLPVAQEAGIRLALHPDDPPLEKMNGVAKVFVHYDGYRRAEEIAGSSRHWGLTFCIGTWSEGGDRMGKSVLEMIRDFGGRGRIAPGGPLSASRISGLGRGVVLQRSDGGAIHRWQLLHGLRLEHRLFRDAGAAVADKQGGDLLRLGSDQRR